MTTAADPTKQKVSDTFVRLMVWARGNVFGSVSQQTFRDYVSMQFSDDFDELFLDLCRVFSKQRIEAERSMARFFFERGGHRRVNRARMVTSTVSEGIPRRVDWPATVMRSTLPFPTEYVSVEPRAETDRQVLSGLRGCAKTWLDQLERYQGRSSHTEELHSRIARLNEVCKVLKGAGTPRPLSPVLLTRLARSSSEGRELAKVLQRLRVLEWGNVSDEEAICNFLKEVAEKVNERARKGNKRPNDNDLLEALIPMLITRAVLDGSGSTLSQPCWSLKRSSLKSSKPNITLLCHWRRATMEVRIGKFETLKEDDDGKVHKKDEQSVCNGLGRDRMLQILDPLDLGKQGARDRQPDTILRFSIGDGEPLFVLGDAKNYRDEANKRNCVEDVLGYFESYGHACHLSLDEVLSGNWSDPPVNPAGTLFLANGAKCVPYKDRDGNGWEPVSVTGESFTGPSACLSNTEEAVGVLNEDAFTICPVLCLDLKSGHLGEHTGGVWDAPILRAWANRIARQAMKWLLKQQGEDT